MIYGVASTVPYMAFDASTGLPKTGDSGNHTLRLFRNGAEATPTNSPSEPDATNAPGVYVVALTASEMQTLDLLVCGKSSTSNVYIVPARLAPQRLPNADPASNGGLPTCDASNRVVALLSNGTGTGQIVLNSGIAGASVAAMATDTLTANALASSAVSEIQTGLSTLDAAGVRSAVGLASANLDTQIGTLSTTSQLASSAANIITEIGTRATPAQVNSTVAPLVPTAQQISDTVGAALTSAHGSGAWTTGSTLTTGDIDARLAAAGVTSAVMARLNSSISACLQAANVPSNFSVMLISTAGGMTLSPTGLDNISVADPGAIGNYTTLPHYIVGLWRWFFKKAVNNTNTGSIALYPDSGTTANMTIAYTNAAGIETKNAAT